MIQILLSRQSLRIDPPEIFMVLSIVSGKFCDENGTLVVIQNYTSKTLFTTLLDTEYLEQICEYAVRQSDCFEKDVIFENSAIECGKD